MKNWTTTLIAAGTAALIPIKPVIICAFILVLADFVFGIWAAKKRGEPITSAGMRRTVSKLFVYEASVICAFMVQQYMMGGVLPLVSLVGGVIGMVELRSIMESGEDIIGMNIFNEIIKKLGSVNDIPTDKK